ncbi:hypothetical protein [Pyrococcus sp. ST04]|uniref:hypothetical protein n=1 Tax=Pyrococcus sp. ST04 TaxID=1183377 RepID=UPI0002605DD1|nr:hypothetical protein [Pyrococcus sp. ST04]AFK23136.1 hypothetical protein Py04_1565 [Pyrococcus sp. ST04]
METNNNENRIDIIEWAKNKKIYKTESWKEFINQLLDFLSYLYSFREFQNWLRKTFHGKKIGLLPEDLKEPAKLIIAGGGYEENAFGRVMFKLFDVKTGDFSNYETSLEVYLKRGEYTTIFVGKNIFGQSKEFFENLIAKIESILREFEIKTYKERVYKKISNIDYYSWINPEEPQLQEVLTNFLNLSLSLLEPSSPYVQFIVYFNTSTLSLLREVLDCSITDIRELVELFKPKILTESLNEVEKIDEDYGGDYILLFEDYGLSKEILEVFGEEGYLHRLLKGVFSKETNVDRMFDELWKERKKAVLELVKKRIWRPHNLLKEALFSKELCEDNINSVVFVKSTSKLYQDLTGVDILRTNEYPSFAVYEIKKAKEYAYEYARSPGYLFTIIDNIAEKLRKWFPSSKTELPVSILLEDAFPLLSTKYLQSKFQKSSWGHSNTTVVFKYLVLKPRNCEDPPNPRSYLTLLKELESIGETL